MKVFVTGGTGFVGSHLLRELAGAGHEVTALVRAPSTLPAEVRSLRGDVETLEAFRDALRGHDALIHNALVWPEEVGSELDMRDTRASARLFQAAAEAGIEHILYTSSTAVHRPFVGVMNEDSPARSNDFYGATKVSGEAFLNAVREQFGIIATVFRPGPVVGAPAYSGGPHKSDRRFTEFIRAARAGESLSFNEGEGRQFIGVRNLAKVYRELLELRGGTSYLVVDREAVAWRDIALEISAKTGSKLVMTTRAESQPFSFDTRRIEAAMGGPLDSRAELSEHIDYLLSATS